MTLRSFTRSEVGEPYQQHTDERWGWFDSTTVLLDYQQPYQQHTDERGQAFHPGGHRSGLRALPRPALLVNAPAYQAVDHLKRNRLRPITASVIDQACECLIQHQNAHRDYLAEKLNLPRVRRVLEPILSGEGPNRRTDNDDLRLVQDLGLLAPNVISPQGQMVWLVGA